MYWKARDMVEYSIFYAGSSTVADLAERSSSAWSAIKNSLKGGLNNDGWTYTSYEWR